MTFVVHQLDTFLLVGAGVTLLAILAVRVSTRAGLPSLLLYLLMGVALGESGIDGRTSRQLVERPPSARISARAAKPSACASSAFSKWIPMPLSPSATPISR